jgi:hypothetical protein
MGILGEEQLGTRVAGLQEATKSPRFGRHDLLWGAPGRKRKATAKALGSLQDERLIFGTRHSNRDLRGFRLHDASSLDPAGTRESRPRGSASIA